MLPPSIELKNTVPRTRSVVSNANPPAKGGNAKSINVIVIRMDHVKMGRRFQVTPFARFLTMVVMKLTEDIVTEIANKARAKAARVAPAWGLKATVFRGA